MNDIIVEKNAESLPQISEYMELGRLPSGPYGTFSFYPTVEIWTVLTITFFIMPRPQPRDPDILINIWDRAAGAFAELL
jgi:hypothetical protein